MNFKKITNTIYTVIIIALVFIALSVALSAFDIGGYKLFSVQSGSMEPTIKTGSIVVVEKSDDYQENDIITFNEQNQSTVTHRLVKKEVEEGQVKFTTKGDANTSTDTNKVLASQIIGKVAFSLPYLGYPVSFARTQTGLIALIIIPATIIVYSELVSIKNETKKIIDKKKAQKIEKQEKEKLAPRPEPKKPQKISKKKLEKQLKNKPKKSKAKKK